MDLDFWNCFGMKNSILYSKKYGKLTEHPDMTIDVYCECTCKVTTQQLQQCGSYMTVCLFRQLLNDSFKGKIEIFKLTVLLVQRKQ